MKTGNIAVFASGSGTNAQNIIEYFADSQSVKVSCLLSNNPHAFALARAERAGIETKVFTREELNQSLEISKYLMQKNINLIVLAGFLWLVPRNLIDQFTIINIHPALLPKYGGKNMYGRHVHEAVLNNREEFSGITIHYVNEEYDDGAIIFQARCRVEPSDTPDTLAARIHLLEYEHYPRVIEQVLTRLAY